MIPAVATADVVVESQQGVAKKKEEQKFLLLLSKELFSLNTSTGRDLHTQQRCRKNQT